MKEKLKEKLKEIRGIGNVCIEIVGEVIYIELVI
jgi:hypothetical protein